MPELVIWQNGECRRWSFEKPSVLSALLRESGVSVLQPCGGRGLCKKCEVYVDGRISQEPDTEKRAGTCLACQTVVYGDAEVRLPDRVTLEQIETAAKTGDMRDPMPGMIGAAVDIGTTTVAVLLLDLKTGKTLSSAACINPQTSFSADVIGRISAAVSGHLEELQALITETIHRLIGEACRKAGREQDDVDQCVITGNTTMLYLLTGKRPDSLARAPFRADCLFGYKDRVLSVNTYFPRCMHAFVGADITCAILSCGMTDRDETALLCDIGTNGELALQKDGVIYVTSTAAGPAFEGAGISCGCGSVTGAIDSVTIENGEIRVHTIGDSPAIGICGSGLIDAVACFLRLGKIDETGALEEDELILAEGVKLLQKDIRAVQLAKAAIAAGIKTLMSAAGVGMEEVKTLYIAGGFGSHLHVDSAAVIGLIPRELGQKVKILANAALGGAAGMLLDRASIQKSLALADRAKHIDLGGNPEFNENYMEMMLFPETYAL